MSIRSFAARGARKVLRILGHDTQRGDGPACTVLFVNGCDPSVAAPRRYRVAHQREQLELWDIATDEVYYTEACAQDVGRGDAIVIYRCPITPGVEQLIVAAHKQDKPVYFDVDDLVCDTSYTNELPVVKAMSPADKAVFDDGVTRNGQTLALCDGAIVSTDRLATELLKVVPQVLINRNVTSQDMVSLSQEARFFAHKNENVVTLGYFSGSMTHNADFQELLPALVKALQTYEHLRLKVVGELELPPELERFSDRVVSADRVSWRELPSLIASVDINLAPIEPTLFNEAKSENKWLEAALVGVPTIASDFGAFAHAIRNGETGLLCANTQEWYDAICMLVNDRAYRERLGEQARLWCLAHNTTATTGSALAALLNTSIEEPRIDALLPRQSHERTTIVERFLTARGFSFAASNYNPFPWNEISLEHRLYAAESILGDNKRLAVFVYERDCGDNATFRYFGYNLVQRLASSPVWGGIWLYVDELARNEELLARASTIILVRCRVRPELVRLAELARESSTPMGYLIDDYALGAKTALRIIHTMAEDPKNTFTRRFWTGTVERFRLASELCSSLIVPVDFFAELLSKETDTPTLVINSSLNNEQVSIAKRIASSRKDTRADSRFIIGYFSGTASHQEDFDLARPAVLRLLAEDPNTCLLLGGQLNVDDELLPYLQNGQLILIPSVDYVTLQYLQAAVDVVLAPLVIDDFANCKSGLKVFEAGVVGTPACASPAAAYRAAINEGVSGYTCDTQDSWYQALAALRDDPKLRTSMGEQARTWALTYYYGPTIRQQVEDACDRLAAMAPLPDTSDVEAVVRSKRIRNWDNPFEASPRFTK
ncbi:MAG: glycosyltransferase [Atopobiaceae bacterium]|nr:glycosyltransferase [Atopobiaceae bacterium]